MRRSVVSSIIMTDWGGSWDNCTEDSGASDWGQSHGEVLWSCEDGNEETEMSDINEFYRDDNFRTADYEEPPTTPTAAIVAEAQRSGVMHLTGRSITNAELVGESIVSWEDVGLDIRKLMLSDNSLDEFPREEMLRHLCNVEQLDVSHNPELQLLPSRLHLLHRLQRLHAWACGLRRVEPAALQLPQMHTLLLQDNELQELPGSVGLLLNLQVLDVSGNLLRCLPASLGALPHLTTLLADRNLLSHDLPSSSSSSSGGGGAFAGVAQELSGAKALSNLSLRSNLLQTLPEALARLAPPVGSLRRLDLSRNPLLLLPTPLLASLQQELLAPLPQEVCPGLFVGDYSCVENVAALRHRGISHVLLAGAELDPSPLLVSPTRGAAATAAAAAAEEEEDVVGTAEVENPQRNDPFTSHHNLFTPSPPMGPDEEGGGSGEAKGAGAEGFTWQKLRELADSSDADLVPSLPQAMSFLVRSRRASSRGRPDESGRHGGGGSPILIACANGVSRAPSIIASYLMLEAASKAVIGCGGAGDPLSVLAAGASALSLVGRGLGDDRRAEAASSPAAADHDSHAPLDDALADDPQAMVLLQLARSFSEQFCSSSCELGSSSSFSTLPHLSPSAPISSPTSASACTSASVSAPSAPSPVPAQLVSGAQALQVVRDARPCVDPNPRFLEQLKGLEQWLSVKVTTAKMSAVLA